jgi:hypothetical protein
MTGVELGCGTGAGFTISGSTPGAGLITPPLASNLSLRFFLWLSTTLPVPWHCRDLTIDLRVATRAAGPFGQRRPTRYAQPASSSGNIHSNWAIAS